ncbi:hypothetical protein [Ideonella dechloratans]|uniref:hypothetical protein n=1 Tax=Ideonella dechloratans TaxID=36863 RepID=UPI0035B294BC
MGRALLLQTGLLMALLSLVGGVRAAPQALDDDALSEVRGAGLGVGVHLELNSSLLTGATPMPNLAAAFGDATQPNYLVMYGVGGIMDLYAVTLNAVTAADGTNQLALGLPSFVGFDDFGVRAISVQSDPTAPLSMASSLGGITLNGSGAMTGRVLLWAR